MKPITVKLSSQGQVLIPKAIRDELHWGNGVELTLDVTEQGVMLGAKAQIEKHPLESLRGFLQNRDEAIPICGMIK